MRILSDKYQNIFLYQLILIRFKYILNNLHFDIYDQAFSLIS